MPVEEKIHKLFATDRISARREIVELFLDENFGTGNGDLTSKYIYTVEKYGAYEIILQRPATLNKGFDFVVKVKGVYFNSNGKRRHQNPSHSDIVDALNKTRKKIGEFDYQKIKNLINEIYEIKNPDYSKVADVTFIDCDGKEHPIIVLLLAIKWLFLEQDITYWNFSGRAMLMNGLWDNKLA